MARISYSMAGEGRGHAARGRALIERLKRRHEVVVYAPGHAYQFLAPLYPQVSGQQVQVREIPGLYFCYDRRGRLHKGRTAWSAAQYGLRLPGLVRRLQQELEAPAERPDLVLCDFEPALGRAAQRAGIPTLSVDHQHFLVVGDLRDLPGPLRRHAAAMRLLVRLVSHGHQRRVVSSFFEPPLREAYRDAGETRQVGVFLRPELRAARPRRGDRLCVYLRRSAPESVLAALQSCDLGVDVFGLGLRPPRGNLEFHDVDERRFIRCLSACRALVCTAGNQLVGEAHWLGKPVLGMPEAGNQEQQINAHFLARSGGGMALQMEELTPATLRLFLDRLGSFVPAAQRRDGAEETEAIIESFLRELGAGKSPKREPAWRQQAEVQPA